MTTITVKITDHDGKRIQEISNILGDELTATEMANAFASIMLALGYHPNHINDIFSTDVFGEYDEPEVGNEKV